MPWRRRPRAAVLWLLSAVTLIAVVVGLRIALDPSRSATSASPLQTSAAAASINNTLMRDGNGCAGVRSTLWHPLSGVEYTGRLRITLPAQSGGAIVLYVGDSIPLDIEATTDAGEPVVIGRERLVAGPGVHVPPDFWLDDGSPVDAPGQISRLTIDALARARVVILALGRRAPRIVARLVGYPSTVRVPVCADPVREGEIYFATGWYGEVRDAESGRIHWMRRQGAVLLASATGRAARIRARLAPAEDVDGQGTQLTVRVNDVLDLTPVTLTPGFRDYEWLVPDAAWVSGTNELLFSVTRTKTDGSRVRGLALASLHVD